MSPAATTGPVILVAGATGDLGGRITDALLTRGARVHALVRTQSAASSRDRLAAKGVRVLSADLDNVTSVAAACAGARCVVSALSGLRDVILDRQSVLIDAAAQAGVPRFISSDFSSDYTKSEPGHNRNFDLRREFAGRADRAPIAVTSIFNGAFMDMLGAEMPLIQPRIRSVLYWGTRHQPLDFTTRADAAAYTAAAALDDTTPRILRIAGDTVTAADMAAAMTRSSGTTYRTLWAGTTGTLGALIPLTRRAAPEKPNATFPAWQGMQYTFDMFSGTVRLQPLDNDRYPDLQWTSLLDRLTTNPPAQRKRRNADAGPTRPSRKLT
jgi:uncharacterized protein YbjT (DUF2867 family)